MSGATPIASRHNAMPISALSASVQSDPWCHSHLEHPHVNVLSVEISAIDMNLALRLAERWIAAGDRGYICVTGVHGVMESRRDAGLLSILNHAAINLPDGMPMTWVGRLQGFHHMDRVFGPDFMTEMCRLSIENGYRNFLYGGKPGVATRLSQALQQRFPGLQVVGTYTPPFRNLTPPEETEFIDQVRKSYPHIIWVGLSTPRQEQFMSQFVQRLGVPLMVGVGAAFDFHTGGIRDCSPWIKRAGLQWLHRLLQDPKHLWRRYLVNNPAFLWQITRQLAGASRPSATDPAK